MTQALLNNLSTVSDLSTKLTSLKDNADTIDFQKVFEKQTNETSQNNTIEELRMQSTTNTTEKCTDNKNIQNNLYKSSNENDELCEEPTSEECSSSEEEISNAEQESDEENNESEISIYDNFLASTIVDFTQQKQQISNKEDSLAEQSNDLTDTKSDNISLELDNTALDNVLDNVLDSITNGSEEINQIKTKETSEFTDKTLEDIVDEEVLNELNIESVESETSDDSSSDLMQNQSPQEQGVKALIQADIPEYSETKTNEVQATTKTMPAQEVANPSKIIEQVSKQMEGMKSGSRVNMILNPESLGKVEIQLINTKEGLSAQFTVATQDAKNLLLKGLDGLKETLAMHGVSIDNVSVKLNESQESKYNSDWTEQENSEGGNKEQNSGREKRDKNEFEQAMSDFNEENGKV